MNKSVIINIARYVISIAMPLLFLCNPLLSFTLVILLLFLNNLLDDISFYYANYEVGGVSFTENSSPVNGTITAIEYEVPLFSHITKEDIISGEEIVNLSGLSNRGKRKWTHVTIFLNKLNHHVVLNPRRLLMCKHISTRNGFVEMVGEGEIVANNNGEYLNNPALVLCYERMYIVLTLDKYVSKYIFGSKDIGQVSTMLLRGSQCDIYIESREGLGEISKHIGDIVQIGEELFASNEGVKIRYVPHNVDDVIDKGISTIGGLFTMVYQNVIKTLYTFRSLLMLAIVVVSLSLYTISHLFSYVAFLAVYLFAIERFYHNLMYSLVNAIGLREWMIKSYKIVSKLSCLWKKRI